MDFNTKLPYGVLSSVKHLKSGTENRVGGVSELLDKEIGRPVLQMKGAVSANNYIDYENINLTGQFLSVQLKLENDNVATFHVELNTTKDISLRITVSTLYSEPRFLGRALRLPLCVVPNKWVILTLDLELILKDYCNMTSISGAPILRSVKRVQLCSNMTVREIVTSRQDYYHHHDTLPKELQVKASNILIYSKLPNIGESVAPRSAESPEILPGTGPGSRSLPRRPLTSPGVPFPRSPSRDYKNMNEIDNNTSLSSIFPIASPSAGTSPIPHTSTKPIQRNANRALTTALDGTPVGAGLTVEALSTEGYGTDMMLNVNTGNSSSSKKPTRTKRITRGLYEHKYDPLTPLRSNFKSKQNKDEVEINNSNHNQDVSAINTPGTKGSATSLTGSTLGGNGVPSAVGERMIDRALLLDRLIAYSGAPIALLQCGDILTFGSGNMIAVADVHGKANEKNKGKQAGIWRNFKGSSENGAEGQQFFLRGHTSDVKLLELSADEKFLASAESTPGASVIFWDMTQGRKAVAINPHPCGVTAISFISDNTMVATAGLDNQKRAQIIVWDFPMVLQGKGGTGKRNNTANASAIIARQISDFHISSLKFAPFSFTELSLPHNSTHGKGRSQFIGSNVPSDKSGPAIASCGRENIRFWRIRKGHLPGRPVELNEYSRGYNFDDLSFHAEPGATPKDPLSPMVFVASNKGLLFKVDAAKEEVLCAYRLHEGPITSLVIHGGYAVTGGADCRLRIWPLTFHDFLLEAHHETALCSVAVSSDGRKLAVGTESGTLGVLDVSGQGYKTVLRSHVGSILSVASRPPHGFEFATVGKDRTIRVWDTIKAQQRFEFKSPTDDPLCIAYHPGNLVDEQRVEAHEIIVGFKSGMLRILDVTTTASKFELQHHNAAIKKILFDPKGRYVYSGSADGIVCVSDSRNEYQLMKAVAVFQSKPKPVPGLPGSPAAPTEFVHNSDVWMAISDDGKWLATSGPLISSVMVYSAPDMVAMVASSGPSVGVDDVNDKSKDSKEKGKASPHSRRKSNSSPTVTATGVSFMGEGSPVITGPSRRDSMSPSRRRPSSPGGLGHSHHHSPAKDRERPTAVKVTGLEFTTDRNGGGVFVSTGKHLISLPLTANTDGTWPERSAKRIDSFKGDVYPVKMMHKDHESGLVIVSYQRNSESTTSSLSHNNNNNSITSPSTTSSSGTSVHSIGDAVGILWALHKGGRRNAKLSTSPSQLYAGDLCGIITAMCYCAGNPEEGIGARVITVDSSGALAVWSVKEEKLEILRKLAITPANANLGNTMTTIPGAPGQPDVKVVSGVVTFDDMVKKQVKTDTDKKSEAEKAAEKDKKLWTSLKNQFGDDSTRGGNDSSSVGSELIDDEVGRTTARVIQEDVRKEGLHDWMSISGAARNYSQGEEDRLAAEAELEPDEPVGGPGVAIRYTAVRIVGSNLLCAPITANGALIISDGECVSVSWAGSASIPLHRQSSSPSTYGDNRPQSPSYAGSAYARSEYARSEYARSEYARSEMTGVSTHVPTALYGAKSQALIPSVRTHLSREYASTVLQVAIGPDNSVAILTKAIFDGSPYRVEIWSLMQVGISEKDIQYGVHGSFDLLPAVDDSSNPLVFSNPDPNAIPPPEALPAIGWGDNGSFAAVKFVSASSPPPQSSARPSDMFSSPILPSVSSSSMVVQAKFKVTCLLKADVAELANMDRNQTEYLIEQRTGDVTIAQVVNSLTDAMQQMDDRGSGGQNGGIPSSYSGNTEQDAKDKAVDEKKCQMVVLPTFRWSQSQTYLQRLSERLPPHKRPLGSCCIAIAGNIIAGVVDVSPTHSGLTLNCLWSENLSQSGVLRELDTHLIERFKSGMRGAIGSTTRGGSADAASMHDYPLSVVATLDQHNRVRFLAPLFAQGQGIDPSQYQNQDALSDAFDVPPIGTPLTPPRDVTTKVNANADGLLINSTPKTTPRRVNATLSPSSSASPSTSPGRAKRQMVKFQSTTARPKAGTGGTLGSVHAMRLGPLLAKLSSSSASTSSNDNCATTGVSAHTQTSQSMWQATLVLAGQSNVRICTVTLALSMCDVLTALVLPLHRHSMNFNPELPIYLTPLVASKAIDPGISSKHTANTTAVVSALTGKMVHRELAAGKKVTTGVLVAQPTGQMSILSVSNSSTSSTATTTTTDNITTESIGVVGGDASHVADCSLLTLRGPAVQSPPFDMVSFETRPLYGSTNVKVITTSTGRTKVPVENSVAIGVLNRGNMQVLSSLGGLKLPQGSNTGHEASNNYSCITSTKTYLAVGYKNGRIAVLDAATMRLCKMADLRMKSSTSDDYFRNDSSGKSDLGKPAPPFKGKSMRKPSSKPYVSILRETIENTVVNSNTDATNKANVPSKGNGKSHSTPIRGPLSERQTQKQQKQKRRSLDSSGADDVAGRNEAWTEGTASGVTANSRMPVSMKFICRGQGLVVVCCDGSVWMVALTHSDGALCAAVEIVPGMQATGEQYVRFLNNMEEEEEPSLPQLVTSVWTNEVCRYQLNDPEGDLLIHGIPGLMDPCLWGFISADRKSVCSVYLTDLSMLSQQMKNTSIPVKQVLGQCSTLLMKCQLQSEKDEDPAVAAAKRAQKLARQALVAENNNDTNDNINKPRGYFDNNGRVLDDFNVNNLTNDQLFPVDDIPDGYEAAPLMASHMVAKLDRSGDVVITFCGITAPVDPDALAAEASTVGTTTSGNADENSYIVAETIRLTKLQLLQAAGQNEVVTEEDTSETKDKIVSSAINKLLLALSPSKSADKKTSFKPPKNKQKESVTITTPAKAKIAFVDLVKDNNKTNVEEKVVIGTPVISRTQLRYRQRLGVVTAFTFNCGLLATTTQVGVRVYECQALTEHKASATQKRRLCVGAFSGMSRSARYHEKTGVRVEVLYDDIPDSHRRKPSDFKEKATAQKNKENANFFPVGGKHNKPLQQAHQHSHIAHHQHQKRIHGSLGHSDEGHRHYHSSTSLSIWDDSCVSILPDSEQDPTVMVYAYRSYPPGLVQCVVTFEPNSMYEKMRHDDSDSD